MTILLGWESAQWIGRTFRARAREIGLITRASRATLLRLVVATASEPGHGRKRSCA